MEVGEDKPENQCLGKRRGPHQHHFLFFTVVEDKRQRGDGRV